MSLVNKKNEQPIVSAIPAHFCLQHFSLALLAELIVDEKDQEQNKQNVQSAETLYLIEFRLPYSHFEQKNIWSEVLDLYLKKPNQVDQLLIEVAQKLQLTMIELLVIDLIIHVEFEAMLGRAIAYLQKPLGGSRPTLGLLETMFKPLLSDSMSTQTINRYTIIQSLVSGNACKTGLFQLINQAAPLPEQAIQLPMALALALTHSEYQWPGTSLQNSVLTQDDLPPSFIDAAKQHAAGLTILNHSALVIHSNVMNESCRLAEVIVNILNKKPLFINDAKQAMQGLAALCFCRQLIPVFMVNLSPAERQLIPMIEGYNGAVLVICGNDGNVDVTNANVSHWHVPYPTTNERETLWLKYLNNQALAQKLANDHVHSISRILQLSRLAMREAMLHNRKTVTLQDVRQVAWLSDGGGLSSLAESVNFRVGDDALVVRKQTRMALELFKKRCCLREHLADDLGVTFQARYQMGVKGLLVGPSGTGKTLAASWLATQLGLPLYRVDLASVTSKYIGETEKNLARLLEQAEQDEVILLFDEADAMFGKRTDVKDSNDRFANAQTNYLLQRIESYKGIVILTSNSKARFDDAFTRRLDLVIEFPHPEAKTRRAIWLKHLGDYHELTTKQMNQIAAKSDLSGGHIRNAVLSAAVYAKDENKKIQIEHVVKGLQGEYKKLGKQISPELSQMMN